MSRLIASDLALRALLVLSQRGKGMRASAVAEALGVSYSGAEKALDILVEDGLAARLGRLTSFTDAPRARRALEFSLAFLEPEAAIAALMSGNEAVEFAAVDARGFLIVLRRFAEPEKEGRLRRALDTIHEVDPTVPIEVLTKERLRDALLSDPSARERAQRMRTLVGGVDRTFPDRTKHGDQGSRPLGRLNDLVRAPSLRRLRAFARAHGLRRIVAFGSAARDDFRPDSDIDLLVEPKPGRRLGLFERVEILADAERLFDRNVDIVTTPITRPSLAQQINRDGVVLYDAAR